MMQVPTLQQLEVLYANPTHPNLLPRDPEWLILAGLGNGNEAQLAARQWPGIKILGADPDGKAIAWQKANSWRDTDPILEVALTDMNSGPGGAQLVMLEATIGASSLHPIMVGRAAAEGFREHESFKQVTAVTLDCLEERYGPFNNAVLWIDAEGYDYRVIRGAHNLLSSGRVMVLTMEVWTARTDLVTQTGETRKYLHDLGYRMVELFGCEWWGHNEVYKLWPK